MLFQSLIDLLVDVRFGRRNTGNRGTQFLLFDPPLQISDLLLIYGVWAW